MSSFLNSIFGNRKSSESPILDPKQEGFNEQVVLSSPTLQLAENTIDDNDVTASSSSNNDAVYKENMIALKWKEDELLHENLKMEKSQQEVREDVQKENSIAEVKTSNSSSESGSVPGISRQCPSNAPLDTNVSVVSEERDVQNCVEGETSDESSVNSNNYGNEISSADFREDDLEGGRKKRRGKKGRERRVRHDESKLIKEMSEKLNGNGFDSDNTGNNSPQSHSQSQSTNGDKEDKLLTAEPSEVEIPPLKTTWRNDHKTLQNKLKFVLFHESNPFCDVIFLVGEQREEIYAHRLILSLSSPVFEEMISKCQKDDTNKIIIPEVGSTVFKELLQFIYTDMFESSKADDIEFALSLMAAAKMFKVPELITVIGKLMKLKLTTKNVIRIYERAEGCVMGDAQQFIMTNAKTVFNTDDFLTLSHPKLCKLLVNNNLILDELTIFDRTLNWAKEECKRMGLEENAENLRGVLHSAIYLIRFPLLTAQEFTFRVLPHGILSESEQLEIFKYFSVRETPVEGSLQLQLKFNCTKRSTLVNVKKQTPVTSDKQTPTKTSQPAKPSLMSLPTAKPLSGPILSNPFPSTSMATTPTQKQNNSQPLIKKIQPLASPTSINTTPLKLSLSEKQIRSDITKDTEAILGNLSDTNFNESIQTFKKLQLCNNEGRVDCFVRALFRKVAERPNMCHLFAKFMLFALQCSHQPTTRLKKQFLEHCQCVFENKTAYDGIVQKLKLKLDASENPREKCDLLAKFEVKQTNLRIYYLSNIRFMGELFKVQLLTPAIMVDSVNSLLQTPDDDALESVCHLLKTCGEKLDLRLQQHNKLSKAINVPEFQCAPNWMDNVFAQLANIFNNVKHLRFETRLMLIELIEIRQNGWIAPNPIMASSKTSLST